MSELYNLKLYPRALQDLDQITGYISENLQNKSAALKLLVRFENVFDNLCRFPQSCPLSRNEALTVKNIRKAVVDNYLVFYIANDEEQQIEVVHIACGVANYIEIL